jgi:hypothetical protein
MRWKVSTDSCGIFLRISLNHLQGSAVLVQKEGILGFASPPPGRRRHFLLIVLAWWCWVWKISNRRSL